MNNEGGFRRYEQKNVRMLATLVYFSHGIHRVYSDTKGHERISPDDNAC